MRRSDLAILVLGGAALVAGSVLAGLWLLGEAVARLRSDRAEIGTIIRGVRLVFLSVGALAAGAGWIVGHPLPIVLALLIAGVDVVETSFLLLLVGTRRVAERVGRD